MNKFREERVQNLVEILRIKDENRFKFDVDIIREKEKRKSTQTVTSSNPTLKR